MTRQLPVPFGAEAQELNLWLEATGVQHVRLIFTSWAPIGSETVALQLGMPVQTPVLA